MTTDRWLHLNIWTVSIPFLMARGCSNRTTKCWGHTDSWFIIARMSPGRASTHSQRTTSSLVIALSRGRPVWNGSNLGAPRLHGTSCCLNAVVYRLCVGGLTYSSGGSRQNEDGKLVRFYVEVILRKHQTHKGNTSRGLTFSQEQEDSMKLERQGKFPFSQGHL